MMKFKKLTRLIVIVIATTVMSLMPLQTFAEHDQAFYSGNDILFYNPDDCPTDSSGGDVSSNAVSGDATANAKSIFLFLISTKFTTNGNKPMTAVQAAGVLGNIQSESGFRPTAIQHPPYDPATAMNPSIDNGFGIAQWSFARRVNLLNFANGKGTWSDLNVQLEFLANELDTNHNIFGTAFGTASTPSQAATLWNQKFEVSADTSNNRLTQAESWYNQFKSLAPTDASSDSGSSCQSNAGGTGTGQCNATSCTTGDGTAASVVSAAMSMVLPSRDAGVAACNQYCGHGPAQPPAYATALKQYIPPAVANNYYGACCATFVSTVLYVAGVENNFASCGAAAVHNYLASHPELFKHVASGVTSVSGLQPGDILSDDGDVYIYVGGGNVAGASYQERMPDIQAAWFDGPRDVYRVIKGAS